MDKDQDTSGISEHEKQAKEIVDWFRSHGVESNCMKSQYYSDEIDIYAIVAGYHISIRHRKQTKR